MLTPAQIQTLKTAIAAEPSLVTAINTANDAAIAAWLNDNSAPVFNVWKSSTSVNDIFDSITFANYTPIDAPDITTQWTNRNLQCQSKQLNLQTFLVGRETINTGKSNIRNGLKDALQQLPSGAGGALLDAGWAAVKSIITRTATRAEGILASGAGTLANPGVLNFEGLVTINEASLMR